ncbi:polysaccharide lyase family 8 super-sandwich domain-containing protein [Draconibacterium mangrovi]|uniref:polysaccharide lyase family 8 super-sandwich domain-containing protein n=1 Tax=Draconibacterium mangrovi TaxID=2697469 RepID=UPI0013D7487E|nr:polysaccharide lyase family 8 super-sandwich domain-containing protein [Draconibacterium mangrovi]
MKRLTVILLFFCCASFMAYAQNDIQIVKDRIYKELMKSEVDDAQIETLLQTLKDDGTWPGIDYSNVSREGFEHRLHTAYLVSLASAFKSKSSEYYKKKKVKAAIELGLKNWVEHDYFCENWWHNQIGTPNYLVTLMLIIGDELDKELVNKTQPIIGRAHINAGGARPGGDRIKIAGIQAKNCLFLGDDEKFDEVVRVIENEIKYVEWIGAKYGYGFRKIVGGFENRSYEGRGIQFDNSFHHRTDGVNNTLSYGLSYAAAFAEWAVYTTGTKFSFSEEKLDQLIDYFLDGICKTSVFGKVADVGAKNRSISREGAVNPYDDVLPSKLISVSDYRHNELQEIIDVRNNKAKPTLAHATFYWDSEHFSFQRPDWFASVRMYSTRNYNMEQPYNSEGFLNHHRGDGTNHISVSADEYKGLAPVMDYQKIPGTTVMQKEEMPGANELQKLGLTDFVGAATDGKYGAVAFDFKSPHDPLIARKAWFFFDKEYVCLGTGISCSNTELPVVTTLNQCILRGDVIVASGGKSSVIEKGETEYENVDLIYHDKLAYVFPEPTTVQLKNNIAKGSWYRINRQTDSPKDEIERDVFELYLDHGKRPSEANYQYIVVPATNPEEVQNNTSKNNITVLQNSPAVQAVWQKELQMCQAVFYSEGTLDVNDDITVECGNPGVLIAKTDGTKITEITVSDPARKNAKMLVSIPGKVNAKAENLTVLWNEGTGMSDLLIDLPTGNYAGSSVTIKL